jgi:nucleoside-triphosphatase THEP1
MIIAKRLIIVGPPGSKRKEIALSLGEYLSEEALAANGGETGSH